MDISYISQEDQLNQKDKSPIFTDQEKIDILSEIVIFLMQEVKPKPVELVVKTKKGNLIISKSVNNITLKE